MASRVVGIVGIVTVLAIGALIVYKATRLPAQKPATPVLDVPSFAHPSDPSDRAIDFFAEVISDNRVRMEHRIRAAELLLDHYHPEYVGGYVNPPTVNQQIAFTPK